MTEQNNRYDELRYYSKPFSYTSIALLEGNATLWGLTPPALKGAINKRSFRNKKYSRYYA